jgi:hypothetical protein
VLIEPLFGVARDSRGRFFMRAAGERKVAVFDANGKYLTAIGREGNGPGEFAGQIMHVFVGRADTIVVVSQPARITYFAPDLRYVREARMPVPRALFLRLLPTGQFVMGQRLFTPNEIGFLYHIMGSTGSVIRSFGGDGKPVVQGRGRGPSTRPGDFVVSVDGQSIWVVHDTIMRFEQWGTDGKLANDIHLVGVPWESRPVDRSVPVTGTRGGQVILRSSSSSVAVAGIDSAGRIWLNSTVNPNGDGANGHPSRWGIQVFDTRSKTLLLAQPSERWIFHVDGAMAYTFDTNPDGIKTVTAWRYTIRDR